MAPDGTLTREEDAVGLQQVRTGATTRQGFLKALGRKSWPWLHAIAERWPCRRCRLSFASWMSGVHDEVNVRIGRPPFRTENWTRFRSGEFEGSYHGICGVCRLARVGVRVFARAQRQRST